MIKSELVQRIATQNPHLYQRDVENIVNAILGEIVAALARGDRVELRGFGAFSVKNRPARTGRNPRTGAHVAVDKKHVPFFKTGKEMRERLNQDRDGVAEVSLRCYRWPAARPRERRRRCASSPRLSFSFRWRRSSSVFAVANRQVGDRLVRSASAPSIRSSALRTCMPLFALAIIRADPSAC